MTQSTSKGMTQIVPAEICDASGPQYVWEPMSIHCQRFSCGIPHDPALSVSARHKRCHSAHRGRIDGECALDHRSCFWELWQCAPTNLRSPTQASDTHLCSANRCANLDQALARALPILVSTGEPHAISSLLPKIGTAPGPCPQKSDESSVRVFLHFVFGNPESECKGNNSVMVVHGRGCPNCSLFGRLRASASFQRRSTLHFSE